MTTPTIEHAEVVPLVTADLEEYVLGDSPRPRRRAKRVERASRRGEALTLRRLGVSTAVIAQTMGVTPRTVQTWIKEAIQAITEEEAEEIRALELARLDAILVPQMRLALEGDGRAADVVLRIMDRRARYLGLDQARQGGFEQVGSLLDALVFGVAR